MDSAVAVTTSAVMVGGYSILRIAVGLCRSVFVEKVPLNRFLTISNCNNFKFKLLALLNIALNLYLLPHIAKYLLT